MDHFERELICARICAGLARLQLAENGQTKSFILLSPDANIRYEAAEVYATALAAAVHEGLYSDEDVLRVLRAQGLWTDQDDRELKTAEQNLEKLKIAKYQATTSSKREMAGKALDATRQTLTSLLSRRHSLDSVTRAGHAALARSRYLVGRLLVRADGHTRVWTSDDFWHDDSPLLDAALRAANAGRPTEAQVREVARTEPWRGRWACRKTEHSVFGRSAANLTDDQLALASWSRVYESTMELPDGPGDDVIADDDMFDGWLLVRRDEQTKERAKTVKDNRLNPKIASAAEVFICEAEPEADSGMTNPEDVAAVEAMNSPAAAAVKRQRLKLVAEKGHVLEAEMPDSRLKILSELGARGVK